VANSLNARRAETTQRERKKSERVVERRTGVRLRTGRAQAWEMLERVAWREDC
jgi:hypothetical protein